MEINKMIDESKALAQEHLEFCDEQSTDLEEYKFTVAALTVLQKMASGEDWLPIYNMPKNTPILIRPVNFPEFVGDLWDCSMRTDILDDELVRQKNPKGQIVTYKLREIEGWKPLCGATHIQMLLEKEMKDDAIHNAAAFLLRNYDDFAEILEARKLKEAYGLCPHCLSSITERERRPNGNDTCKEGHKFPSKDALPDKSNFERIAANAAARILEGENGDG